MPRLGHDQHMAAKQPTQEPPQAEQPPAPTQNGERFFTWMRSLGIVRQPGWIGGVAAGFADRLGIDAVIVRGIIVVVALLGGPALLLYAAAWLLLPDQNDKIHLEQVFNGKLESPIAGIGAMILLSMLPVTQGFWFAGSAYWGEPQWDGSVLRALWTISVLIAIVALVVWVARRGSVSPTVTPATTDDRPETIPQPVREDAATVPQSGQPDAAALVAPGPPPPSAAPADASAEALAAWRQQQAEWKQHNAEWKAQQRATDRELREQRAVAARERSLEHAAAAAEQRRLHRQANPRISAAAGWGAIGAAIVAGAGAAFAASSNPEAAGFEVTIGFATAAMVLGVSVILAGALRKRSGILSFLALIAIVVTVATAVVPRDRDLLGFSAELQAGASSNYVQPVGDLRLWVGDNDFEERTEIWQGAGQLSITVQEGAAARIEIVSRYPDVHLWEREVLGDGTPQSDLNFPEGNQLTTGEWLTQMTVGSEDPEAEVHVIRVWQGNGHVSIDDQNPSVQEEVAP